MVGGRRDVMDTLLDKGVMHGGTYNGNVQSMAAALAALDVLEAGRRRGLSRPRGARHAADARACRDLQEAQGSQLVVQGLPAIFQVYLHRRAGAVATIATPPPATATRRSPSIARCRKRASAPTSSAKWFLSTAHDDAIIDETLAAADRAMAAIA